MPKFFVPAANTPAMAEEAYQSFVKIAGLGQPVNSGRLYQVAFPIRLSSGAKKGVHIATVNKEISGWPEYSGPVLAILEMQNVLCIHTLHRGGKTGSPILVSTGEASARVYFDDFPAPT